MKIKKNKKKKKKNEEREESGEQQTRAPGSHAFWLRIYFTLLSLYNNTIFSSLLSRRYNFFILFYFISLLFCKRQLSRVNEREHLEKFTGNKSEERQKHFVSLATRVPIFFGDRRVSIVNLAQLWSLLRKRVLE